MKIPRAYYYTSFETWTGGSKAKYHRIEMRNTEATAQTVAVTPIRTNNLYLTSFDNLVKVEIPNIYSSPSFTNLKLTMPT